MIDLLGTMTIGTGGAKALKRKKPGWNRASQENLNMKPILPSSKDTSNMVVADTIDLPAKSGLQYDPRSLNVYHWTDTNNTLGKHFVEIDGAWSSYIPDAKHYIAQSVKCPTLKGVASRLQKLQAQANTAIVIGAPDATGQKCRRITKPSLNDADHGHILTRPREVQYFCCDIDEHNTGKPFDPDTLSSVELRALVDNMLHSVHLPTFVGKDCIVNWSSGAAHSAKLGKVKLHLWFELNVPVHQAKIAAWLDATTHKAVDTSVLRTAQLNYTAPPLHYRLVADGFDTTSGVANVTGKVAKADMLALDALKAERTMVVLADPLHRRVRYLEGTGVVDASPINAFVLSEKPVFENTTAEWQENLINRWVLERLEFHGAYKSASNEEGKHFVVCPLSHEHSSDETENSCAVMEGGTGGIPRIALSCFHHSHDRAPTIYDYTNQFGMTNIVEQIRAAGDEMEDTLEGFTTFEELQNWASDQMWGDVLDSDYTDFGSKSTSDTEGGATAETYVDALEHWQALTKKMHVASSSDADLLTPRKRNWVINDVLPAGTLSSIFGPSYSGKTYVTLDMCLHIAAGVPWCGKPTKQRHVVYYAAEAPESVLERVRAWVQEYPEHEAAVRRHFILLNDAWRLPIKEGDMFPGTKIPRTLAAYAKMLNVFKQPVFVLDTLQQSLNGDDSSGQDMPMYINSLKDLLHSVNGMTAVVIHHTGHSAQERARGHSSWYAALDTELKVSKDAASRVVLTPTKQRIGNVGDDFVFDFKERELAGEYEEDDITPVCASLVVFNRAAARKQKPKPVEAVDADDKRAVIRHTSRAAYTLVEAWIELAAELSDPFDEDDAVPVITTEELRPFYLSKAENGADRSDRVGWWKNNLGNDKLCKPQLTEADAPPIFTGSVKTGLVFNSEDYRLGKAPKSPTAA